ncbi:hypothetical protein [Prosthecobacter sp.]|uniref:hypothetical protein n=1 Tax=Prosthecobacter sp. TaxID=1965333 RepID=UPI003783364C
MLPSDFLSNAIRPALNKIGNGGADAEELLLGTAIQESQLRHRHQIGGGPAVGLFQMEPATHNDIWSNYLAYHKALAAQVTGLMTSPTANKITELANNDKYAAAMARVHYLRRHAQIPHAGDIAAMAACWKRYWNTHLGKGTERQYVENWNAMMGISHAPQLLVSREKCFSLLNQLIAAKTKYGLGSKAHPINAEPSKIKAIDCSGLVRYLVYNASKDHSFPDGSWTQMDYLTKKKFRKVDYKHKASLNDSWLRIAFIKKSGSHPGHVWLIHNGKTIESHGGKGPDRRPWNASVLVKGVCCCFDLGPM